MKVILTAKKAALVMKTILS